MALLRVTVRGERHLDQRFRERLTKKRKAVHVGVRESLYGILRGWLRRVGRKSGRMARSGRVVMGSPPRGRGRVEIAPAHMDPRWEEFPTRPHTIVPRKPGGVLVFVAGGKTVFARRVRHPGTRGSRALQSAVDASRRVLAPRLQSILDAA